MRNILKKHFNLNLLKECSHNVKCYSEFLLLNQTQLFSSLSSTVIVTKSLRWKCLSDHKYQITKMKSRFSGFLLHFNIHLSFRDAQITSKMCFHYLRHLHDFYVICVTTAIHYPERLFADSWKQKRLGII